MNLKQKYIITKKNIIIVFPELLEHSDFKIFEPIRAGFISFGINRQRNPTCSCYGKSISLGLTSSPKEDTEIAKRQLDMLDEY